MNLINKCTQNEIKLIEKAGVKVENKDYTADELKKCEADITDYIMSHSSKNGDISKLSCEYSGVLSIIANN